MHFLSILDDFQGNHKFSWNAVFEKKESIDSMFTYGHIHILTVCSHIDSIHTAETSRKDKEQKRNPAGTD